MWTPDVQWVVEEVLVVVEEESPWDGKVSPFKSFIGGDISPYSTDLSSTRARSLVC